MKKQVTVHFRLTVILDWQPEQVYTVTCKELPELITEGRTIDEALDHAADAFISTLELYEDLGKPLPDSIFVKKRRKAINFYNSPPYLSFNLNTPPREVILQSP